jgi:hypothetical protein
MTSVPFFEKGKLLKHGEKTQEELKEYVPIEYILQNVQNDYVNKYNFFIIEAATGSGKSFTLPIAFYKNYNNYNTIVLQPKILTVKQLEDDYTAKENNYAEKYVGEKFEIGKNLSMKSSLRSIHCYNKHCLTIGSYGSFIKKLTNEPEYINKFKIIILDEIHEDAPEVIDLLLFLYYNKDKVLPIIILTSATLQLDKFNKYFNIPLNNHYVVAGKTYNKIIKYEKNDVLNTIDKIVDILKEIINTDKLRYDILIFITSGKEILDMKKNEHINKLKNIDSNIEIIGISREYITTRDPDYDLYIINNENRNLNTRKRQIIFGTNAAETGITINNLKYIINIGFELKKEYIPYLNGYVLYKSAISLSSEIQRIGRVGRKFDGVAYNLYTKEANEKMNKHRSPSLITNNLIIQLLNNFNKIKYIEDIPIELVYDAVFNLYILGYLFLDVKYNIDNLYDCISYTYDTGYIIDGYISKMGIIAKDIIHGMEDIDGGDDRFNLNDVKLILLCVYFNVDLSDITSIIAMVKMYGGEIKKDTNNDFLELLKKYNELISDKKIINNKYLLKETKIDKIVYYKHKILKTLYNIGFDITHEKKKKMLDKHILIKYIIQKIFYNSFINFIIFNKKYRNFDIICRTSEECITNKIDVKQNFKTGEYAIKTNYLCIVDNDSFNNKSHGLIYI